MELPDPASVVRAEGPWTHRDIAANACRFHVVEAGDGPLVVLVHGSMDRAAGVVRLARHLRDGG